MYNMIHGFDPAAIFILPMLGKHPDAYPRFRDCFIQERGWVLEEGQLPVVLPKEGGEDKGIICIFTQAGGGNREEYAEAIEEMRQMEGYLRDYDDKGDPTYATFVFTVPERWMADYKALTDENGFGKNFSRLSEAYRREIMRVYPKLAGILAPIFFPIDDIM